MENYGKEVVLDIHNCKIDNFNEEGLEKYFAELCDRIDMVRCDLHFWDSKNMVPVPTEPHLVGISAIQFIKTSNVTIHTLTDMKRVYLNIFSCKDFEAETVIEVSKKYFGGDIISSTVIDRI